MSLHLFSARRLTISVSITALLIIVLMTAGVMPAFAASSWNPTLLVNTESFQTIDAGDGTTNIELRFGSVVGKTLVWSVTNNRFEFNDKLFVGGDLTASGSVTARGALSGLTLTVGGNVTIRGATYAFPTDGRTASGKFLATNGSGQLVWSTAVSYNRFVGTTTATSSGSFKSGGLVGYQAGNRICSLQYANSHICTVPELVSTIARNVNEFQGYNFAWASMGAPGFTANANDCSGWTSNNNGYLGSWWQFSVTGGGQGFLTNCAVVQPIACCR